MLATETPATSSTGTPTPGTLVLSGGALSYDASTLFLTMVGNVDVPDGSVCAGGGLSVAVFCPSQDAGEPGDAGSNADAAPIDFPVGVYSPRVSDVLTVHVPDRNVASATGKKTSAAAPAPLSFGSYAVRHDGQSGVRG